MAILLGWSRGSGQVEVRKDSPKVLRCTVARFLALCSACDNFSFSNPTPFRARIEYSQMQPKKEQYCLRNYCCHSCTGVNRVRLGSAVE